MSGEVVISVNAIVAPGREQEFLHVMSTAASESRMEPGCVCFHVSKLPGERAYMFYEVYQNDAAVEFHKGTPHYQAWNKFRETGGIQSLNAQVCDGVFIAPDAYTAYAEQEQELRAHAHSERHRIHVELDQVAHLVSSGADPDDLHEPGSAWKPMHHHDAEVARTKQAKRKRNMRHWKTKMWKRRTQLRRERVQALRALQTG